MGTPKVLMTFAEPVHEAIFAPLLKIACTSLDLDSDEAAIAHSSVLYLDLSVNSFIVLLLFAKQKAVAFDLS